MPSSPPTPASASNANLLLSGANGSVNGNYGFLSTPAPLGTSNHNSLILWKGGMHLAF